MDKVFQEVIMDATAPEIPKRNPDELLREHEIIYQTMFEASTDAIFVESLDGHVLDCNSASCRMFGYSRQEFLQLTVADLVPPEVAKTIPDFITQELADGGVFINAVNRRKDGQVFPVEVNTRLFSIGPETRAIVYVRDMTERCKAEKVQAALYRISESAHTAENLNHLYGLIHSIICELMPAENFYIALFDPVADILSFPYYADEADTAPKPQQPGRGLTEYVLRHGQPLLATPEVFKQLQADGQVERVGAPSIDWVGVPLVSHQKIIGMMAVQTYDPAVRLSQVDQNVLAFVSTQVAMAIERKQAEKAHRESEMLYRTLFETTPIGIVLSNPQGQILDVNQVALDMLGSPSAEATKAINMLEFPPLIQSGFSTDFQKCLDNKQLVISECPYTSKWGKSTYLHYYNAPIMDIDGQVTLVQTLAEDITERKKSEQALYDNEMRLRLIFETTLDYIYMIDRSYRVQYINHVIVGLAPETVMGANVLEFTTPEFRPSGKVAIDQVFESGQIANYTSMFQMGQEKPRWFETNIGPIHDGTGHVVAAMLVSRDITERKIAEEKIKSLNQGLERQAEQLTLLYDAGLALNQILNPREQLEYLAQITIKALHADNSGFFRYDPVSKEIFYEFGVGRGVTLETLQKLRTAIGDEHGLVGWIAQERKPFYLPDVTQDPRWVETDPEFRSALWVPVEHEEHLLGILSVVSTRLDAFSQSDQHLLELFANQVAVSLENARLYRDALDAAERRTTLHWLSQEIIAASLEPERIYVAIHQAVLKLMPAEAFVISVLDEATSEVELVYSVDLGKRYPIQRIPCQRGLSGYVISAGSSLVINDLVEEGSQYDLFHFGEAPIVRSILAVPMRLGDKIFGMISVQSYQVHTYSAEDSHLLEILAAYAAIALENSRMIIQMQDSNRELGIAYEEMLEGWSRALEMRDKETKGHSERVTRLSIRLANAMGMPEAEIVTFRRGVLLHDIGKMAIPDSILLKPSSLTEDEWIFMRQHPSYAYQMLGDLPFIRQSLDVPYCHHEKWDGSGYPRGLKGEDIPLGARIFAVVDVWDALINDRPYRPGWLPDVVRAYIESQSGFYFDPRVVVEFLKILDTDQIT